MKMMLGLCLTALAACCGLPAQAEVAESDQVRALAQQIEDSKEEWRATKRALTDLVIEHERQRNERNAQAAENPENPSNAQAAALRDAQNQRDKAAQEERVLQVEWRVRHLEAKLVVQRWQEACDAAELLAARLRQAGGAAAAKPETVDPALAECRKQLAKARLQMRYWEAKRDGDEAAATALKAELQKAP